MLWLLSGASSEGTRPWRPLGRPGSWLIEYISVSAVTAAGGFALTASPFCQTTQKEPKSLAPNVRPLAKARGSFAPAFIRGHRPPVGFAGTYMRCVRLRRTALRANPRINASTQPAEGAGGSRSKAAGELTLGLMSGEKRRGGAGCSAFCSSVGASLLAMAVLQPTIILWLTPQEFVDVRGGCRTRSEATPPCVVAYNYARIRRLVGLGP